MIPHWVSKKWQIPVGLRKIFKVLAVIGGILLCLGLIQATASLLYETDVICFGPAHIVGAYCVIYTEDGGCFYTNPVAMIRWHLLLFGMVAVATFGCAMLATLVCALGGWKPFHLTRKVGLLLFCIIFSGIFCLAGKGLFAWQCRQIDALWGDMKKLSTTVEFEQRFGKASYHYPEVTEDNIDSVIKVSKIPNREFALGKEVWVFSTSWPFRRIAVWLKNGEIVKKSWCSWE